jgi:hypothetical protein
MFTNMKNALTGLTAGILLSLAAVTSLPAQTNLENDPATPALTNSNSRQTAGDQKNQEREASTSRRHGLNGLSNNAVMLSWAFVSFGIPVSIMAMIIFARHRRHQMANETLRAMIEKGLPITPELVESLKSRRPRAEKDKSPHKDLKTGLILTGVGFGVVIMSGRPGWIVLFLGLAFLLIGLLSLGKTNKSNDQTPR